jgi:hypothetical protein
MPAKGATAIIEAPATERSDLEGGVRIEAVSRMFAGRGDRTVQALDRMSMRVDP